MAFESRLIVQTFICMVHKSAVLTAFCSYHSQSAVGNILMHVTCLGFLHHFVVSTCVTCTCPISVLFCSVRDAGIQICRELTLSNNMKTVLPYNKHKIFFCETCTTLQDVRLKLATAHGCCLQPEQLFSMTALENCSQELCGITACPHYIRNILSPDSY